MFKYVELLKGIWVSIFNILFVICLNVLFLPMRLKRNFRSAGRIHILGTGPSLKKDFDDLLREKRLEDSVLCVNGFATSELYEKIRPNLYMIADDAFFRYELPEDVDNFVKNVIKSINEKTQWELNLIVPFNKSNSRRLKEITNKNVHIYTFPNIPIYGGLMKVNAIIYYLKIANPIYQNVINCATCFSIRTGYNEICLWGTDHNWVSDLVVLHDNRIYSKNSHFYDKGEPEYTLSPIENVPVEMENEARCFRAYHELRMYADMKNIKVVNCSSNSWIDAFERRSQNETIASN